MSEDVVEVLADILGVSPLAMRVAVKRLNAAGFSIVRTEPTEAELDQIENHYADCVDLNASPRAAATNLRRTVIAAAGEE